MTRKTRRLEAELAALRSQLDLEAEVAGVEAQVLREILSNISQGVIVVDADDAISFFNSAAAAMIRPGNHLSALAPHPLQNLVRDARGEQVTKERELEVDRPHRILTALANPVAGSGRVLVVLVDVTEARRIEAVRRDFAVAASHELKTPVASILASAEAMQLALDRDPTMARRFSQQVESSARKLADLVTDLLDLSRLESRPEASETIDVTELVETEARTFAERAAASQISLWVEAEPGKVAGSRSDLGVALRNLVDNALRHTPAGGEVRISGASQEGSYRIEVRDTGEGISSRDLPRIFERFYRVDGARARSTGGTGLGLALVRHIVDSHRGTVEVQSTLGEGSTFVIDLPL